MIRKAYGFVADPTKSVRHNIAIRFTQYPVWLYSQPRNRQCHNLCTALRPPSYFHLLLGLGLNFCPTPHPTALSSINESLARFRRDYHTRIYFSGSPSDFTAGQLFIRSTWEPKQTDISPEHQSRELLFRKSVLTLFNDGHYRRRVPSNLTPYQSHLLRTFRNNTDFIVFPTDKNLGPAILERSIYVRRVLDDHLSDPTIYQRLTEEEASRSIQRLAASIRDFIRTHAPTRAELDDAPSSQTFFPCQVTELDRKFLERCLEQNEDPFSYFYISAKVHKTPWKTRPIVSYCGSLAYGIAKWLDQQLQPLARQVPSYIKSSYDLKCKLFDSEVDWNTIRFFTFDAQAMYTNIETNHALEVLSDFLRNHPICRQVHNKEAIITALELVMRNNIFKFGDTTWIQRSGTAMGTPPGCSYATIYYAIHELSFVPSFTSHCPIYYRYIDDGIGGWRTDPDPTVDQCNWQRFCDTLPFGNLRWDVSERSKSVHFLDLDLTIKDDTLHSRIYEKPENMYLYLPPHSAHPSGMVRGLVTGQIKRFLQLCSNEQDSLTHIRDFYRRLVARGHSPTTLKPLFESAYKSQMRPSKPHHRLQPGMTEFAQMYLDRGEDIPDYFYEEIEQDHRIFLHLPYNPDAPSRRTFQRLLSQSIIEPEREPPLNQTNNLGNQRVEIDRVTIAYHRPPNLRRRFFARKFQAADGQPVSSFFEDT